MTRCLNEDKLELLVRGHAQYWRALFWRFHVQRCPACRARWCRLMADEQLLAELRHAANHPLPSARAGTGNGLQSS